VGADVGANGGDEGRHAAERAPPQALARNLGKEALDEIQPGRAGWGEVEMKPRVVREPDEWGHTEIDIGEGEDHLVVVGVSQDLGRER